jgi:hypothetical protein
MIHDKEVLPARTLDEGWNLASSATSVACLYLFLLVQRHSFKSLLFHLDVFCREYFHVQVLVCDATCISWLMTCDGAMIEPVADTGSPCAALAVVSWNS